MKYIFLVSLVILLFLIMIGIIINRFRNSYFSLIYDMSTDIFCKDEVTPICEEVSSDVVTKYEVESVYTKKNNIISLSLLLCKFLSNMEDNKYNDLKVPYDTKLIYWNKDNSLPFCIIINKDIILFRGTRTIMDAVKDVTFAQIYLPNNVKIHKGFYDLYNDIKKEILENLDLSRKINIIGHSLGCGLSACLAYDLCSRNVKNQCVLLAPPKIGNVYLDLFLRKNNSDVYSIINYADLVPSLPFSYMMYQNIKYQYYQIGKITYFNNIKNTIHDCHSPFTYYEFLKNNEDKINI